MWKWVRNWQGIITNVNYCLLCICGSDIMEHHNDEFSWKESHKQVTCTNLFGSLFKYFSALVACNCYLLLGVKACMLVASVVPGILRSQREFPRLQAACLSLYILHKCNNQRSWIVSTCACKKATLKPNSLMTRNELHWHSSTCFCVDTVRGQHLFFWKAFSIGYLCMGQYSVTVLLSFM